MTRPILLALVELGGYPDFTPLYRRLGCEVVVERRLRKALATVRRLRPKVVVAEFNYQSDFRDRTSSLESLQAVVQRLPETRVIVFYEPAQAAQFARLRRRFEPFRALAFPIDEAELEAAVRDALQHAPGPGGA
ncbi:MAG: hypothetical protein D6721_06260 [Gammaproteobacteria bacterium]|nr:MAG: hypothetical protein D6721_06260 [Gammaproteobacteria bacterium]